MSEKEKIDCFNRYKYCYVYDPFSFYATIAAVCGCIPIVMPEPGKSEKDYVTADHPHHYGIAYGDTEEQIQYAIDTRDLLLQSLNYDSKNLKNTDFFAQILEQRFGELKRI